jgi:hypothetical protein
MRLRLKFQLWFFVSVALSTLSIRASAQFGANNQINTTGFVEIVKLPQVSNIYPDTFAIYWRPYKHVSGEGVPTIKFKFAGAYGDFPIESDFVADSIYGFVFEDRYKNESGLSLDWVCRIGDQPIFDFNQVGKALKVLERDPEIEALRLLVSSVFRWQNLKLLADAYERKQCFVNAYYVYLQIIYVDEQLGQQLFEDFYLRNRTKLDSPIMRANR